MIRNLLYNCFPATWSEEWLMNVEMLCRYAHVFNGRRLIMVKTGEHSASLDEVKRAFEPLGECEFYCFPNNPHLGEVVGFLETMARLESTRDDEATFYAHTKGCKYVQAPERYRVAIRQWRNTMYYDLLSDIPRVEDALKEFGTCGCYLIPREAAPLPMSSRWHYSGTFFWFRHSLLFNANWNHVGHSFWGVEAYLGHFIPLENVCNFREMPSHSLYATLGKFKCELCGEEFEARMKMKERPKKLCKACNKRSGVFVSASETSIVGMKQ